LALFAEIGGLGGGVFALIEFFCTEITYMYIIDKFIKLFYTNNQGIYKLDSDKLIPTEDEVNKSETIGK